MPSKKRYILFTPTERFKGSQVVAMLCKVAQANLFNIKLPEGWAKFSTQQKLEFLAQFLPKEYKLVIMQEPKHTRKKRSLYVQAWKKPSKILITNKAGQAINDGVYPDYNDIAIGLINQGGIGNVG